MVGSVVFWLIDLKIQQAETNGYGLISYKMKTRNERKKIKKTKKTIKTMRNDKKKRLVVIRYHNRSFASELTRKTIYVFKIIMRVVL